MKLFRLFIFCCLGVASLQTPAGAQTQVASPKPPAPAQSTMQAAQGTASATQGTAQPSSGMLTLQDAEQIALKNHPRIQQAQNLASAAEAQRHEVRAAYFPNAYGSISGAASLDNARIGAGTFNDPRVFDKFAQGVTASQLITDFGRTHELVKSSTFHAQAQEENIVASRADVLLAVDRAYFGVLRAQAVLNVAKQTVQNRQLVSDQISTMAKNQLKSDLDVTFANVDLAQSQLLLIQAQNDLEVSFADLSAALGNSSQQTFQLVEQPQPAAPPGDIGSLIQEAMANRPELISGRLDVSSAQSYVKAERDLSLPTVSAIGAAGLIPFRAANDNGLDEHYAAAGVNINIPIFNGHLYGSLHAEALARSQAQSQALRDLTDSIARDVRSAWLDANSAYQRLSVTTQLLSQATQSLNLAQARYNLGLSSIIELSQSQLNLTQAQIADATARYDYQTETSILNYQLGNLH